MLRRVPALALLLALGCAERGARLSLAPSSWPAGERERYAARALTWGDPKGECIDAGPMLVSTSGALAIHAGWRALEAGGSAADAAIVTALGQIVSCGGSWDSLAGMLYALVYDAESGRVHALNAGFDTPRGETDPATIPRAPEPSGRTALVGGFGAGIEALHRRFGRLRWEELFGPAIELAEDGVVVDAFLSKAIAARKEVLGRTAAGREVFFEADGAPLGEGALLRQTRLAATLGAVARGGAAHLYTGDWARQFVAAVRDAGGRVEAGDLSAYEARWEEPLRTVYHGHEIATIGHPELGGVQLVEALNLLEHTPLPRERPWREDPAALHRFIQVARVAYAISYSAAYRPHPDDPQPVPWIAPTARLEPAHAERLAAAMQLPDWETRLAADLAAAVADPAPAHSDTIVAVDARGNVVALVHSINTSLWGSTGLFVDGVSVPDPASFQQAMMAKAGPGRRLPNIVNPVIALDAGRPVLAAASIGNALHESMLEHVVDVLDQGLTPQQAIEAPHFWGPWWGSEPGDYRHQAVDAGRFDPAVTAAVEALGQPLRELPETGRAKRVSYQAGIRFGAGGERCGAVSPDFNGLVHTGR